MKIAVIGCGNVGTHLHRALEQAGHQTQLVHGRTGTVPQGYDIYIICVRDEALPQVAQSVAAAAANALVLHTAGSIDIDIIQSPRHGVLYPMQTFSRERELDLAHVPLFIEANSPEALEQTEAVARSISDNVTPLSSTQRHRLHVAAVFASNFVNHCMNIADSQLQQLGLDWRTMLPLLDEVTAKLHTMSPTQAQTGPAVRGDQSVMAEHETMLASPAERDIYHLLSANIALYASKSNNY